MALEAFYLKTYLGTELEDRCMACVVKPPDDVCNACDFDAYHADNFDPTPGVATNSAFISDGQLMRRSPVVGSNNSSNDSSDSSSDSSMGLSKECEACVVSHHACFLRERAKAGGGAHRGSMSMMVGHVSCDVLILNR